MTFLYFAFLIILLFALAPEDRRDRHPDVSWWRHR